MGVRVAYGQKADLQTAINNGSVPPDTIVITRGDFDSEMLFYDVNKNLIPVAERTRFETFTEAEQWAKNYPCVGFIFSVQNGSEWMPYIVQNDNSLAPFKGEDINLGDIKRIDGGASAGM